jgi:hypothetical protein
MIIQRRNFIAGLGALIAAPAIVRAASLMPVRALSNFDWEITVPAIPVKDLAMLYTMHAAYKIGQIVTWDGVDWVAISTRDRQ